MAWELIKTIDATALPDTPASGTLALLGMSCARSDVYYVSGGRIRAHHPTSNIPPLYYNDGGANLRHKVQIVADAPVLTTATTENNATQIAAVEHYDVGGGVWYTGGFCGGSNFGPSGPLNQLGHAIPGNLIIHDDHVISAPATPITITLTNLADAAGSANLQVVTSGDSLTVNAFTEQPNAGYAGLLITGKDAANSEAQGVSSLTIWRYVPGGELTITAPTGTATASGTTVTVTAPTYSAANSGDVINYAWKYTTAATGTPATISGHSGSVVAPAVIPPLVWDVPVGQQYEGLWITCKVDDGVTTFDAQGYFAGVFAIGGNGCYVPAYVPCPIKPSNGTISALWTPPVSGKTIYAILADSIRWQWSHPTDQIQPLCDAIFGAGKVLVLNGGNPGTLITHWYRDVVVGFASQTYSQIPGYESYNNYEGLRRAILANYVAGDQVVLGIALGTNYPAPIGTYLSDIETLLQQLAVTYADFVTVGRMVPVILHDLPTFRYNQVQSVPSTIYEPFLVELRHLESFFSRGHLYVGEQKSRAYFMTHRALMQPDPDGVHPDTDQGNDAVMRFDIAAFAPVAASAWAASGLLGVRVVQVGANAVLTWDASPTAVHYLVMRAATATGQPTLLAIVNAPTVTYTDVAPPNGTEYYVVVPTPY